MGNESRKLAKELARKRIEHEKRQKAAEQAHKTMLAGEMAAAKREREAEQAVALAEAERRRAIPPQTWWLIGSVAGIILLQGIYWWHQRHRPPPAAAMVARQAEPAGTEAAAAAIAQVQVLVSLWNEGGATALAPCWAPSLPPWLRAAGEMRLASAPPPLQFAPETTVAEPGSGVRLVRGQDNAGKPLTFRLGGDAEQLVLLGIE